MSSDWFITAVHMQQPAAQPLSSADDLRLGDNSSDLPPKQPDSGKRNSRMCDTPRFATFRANLLEGWKGVRMRLICSMRLGAADRYGCLSRSMQGECRSHSSSAAVHWGLTAGTVPVHTSQ